MNTGYASGSSGSGVLGDMIQGNIKKVIQDIKEIAGKHSDDDIYAMLKECNMDPNETAQRLLYIDTFHEVKKKRDKRKSNVSTQSSIGPRLTSSMQRRGPRGGRGSNSSTHIPDDAGRRRQVSGRRENGGTNHTERSADLLLPVEHRKESNAALCDTDSSVAPANEPRNMSNGSSSGYTSRVSADNIIDVGSGTSVPDVRRGISVAVVNNLVKNPALPTVAVKQLPDLNPGPTPAPTPTTTSLVSSGARFDGQNSESRSSNLPTSINTAPLSGVYSSASDPVLLPSLKPRNPGAVGAIKRQIGSLRSATEFIGSSSERRLNASQDDENNGEAGTGAANRTSRRVEENQNSDPPRTSSLSNDDKSYTAINKPGGWPTQQVNGPSKDFGPVMKSLGASVAHGANTQSLSKLDDSVLEQASSQLDAKLEKLNISSRQPVIFPDNIQVPEAFRNGLTFGSLDDASGQIQNGIKDSKCVNGTILTNHDAAREPLMSHQSASSAALEGDYHVHPNAAETLSPLEVNASSAAASKPDQLTPEILPHIGGSQYGFLHTTPDYSFGLVPPVLAPNLVQVEATEVGNSTVSATSGSSQPATQSLGVGQNSVAVSPQLLPFLRQPYPSNYFPYPYFPQFYVSHNAPQFLGHGGFTQQASAGNIYMPPAAAATGVKFPVPQLYKPGTIAGNLAHFGIPSGYGSYGSTAIAYGLGAAITPSSSASNEDLTAPEPKEKNTYSTVKQTEEPHVWASATGRDMSTLQANFFYNFPQGQNMAFSPANSGQGPVGGMYHLSQTTVVPTSVQSLPQQSQESAGSAESVVPQTGTYQQPHSHINWNSKLLNRDNI